VESDGVRWRPMGFSLGFISNHDSLKAVMLAPHGKLLHSAFASGLRSEYTSPPRLTLAGSDGKTVERRTSNVDFCLSSRKAGLGRFRMLQALFSGSSKTRLAFVSR